MEPTKKIKISEGEGLDRLPNGQPIPATLPPEQTNLKVKQNKNDKKKHRKIYRKFGDEKWVDNSLEEWDDNDYRVFIGNLAVEVNEDSIRNAFRKFLSIQKIKIIRDKKSNRSKGFGFISFLNPDEYLQAFREMNGKFIGSQPITMKKSDWKKKSLFKS
ncbi:hypothetical protein SteCoe_1526 [Stentor coeruleus]|uniref:RRM domain-containing protein n=1 Tax=Stentor coeruleus TaxID=5963 RepID=A0A1R2D1M5_9CILI|nr:hypothetical protein SteCoe_1526 [Stentor coeruleus]